MKISILAIMIMAASITGCNQQATGEVPKGLETPIAKVDGEFITVADLLEHPGAQDLVDELIYERLVTAKANEMGLDVTEEMVLSAMEPYIVRAGGRMPYLERQREMGMTYDKMIQHGKLSLFQDMILDDMIEEPVYDDVVEFLETQYGEEILRQKAEELGKPVEDVTVEEAYDDAVMVLQALRKRKVLEERTLDETLPVGHEVVNLLRAALLNDPRGDEWAAADPMWHDEESNGYGETDIESGALPVEGEGEIEGDTEENSQEEAPINESDS
jgi:hypothetical protein